MRRALDEYTIGGIKTTLPFFREIVRDSEFIEGRLDTGFISRWQERRQINQSEHQPSGLAAESDDLGERRDIALIAAALDYQHRVKANSVSAPTGSQTVSRWKNAGRAALHRGRI